MAETINFRGGTTENLRTEIEEREKYRNQVDFSGMIDTLYEDFSYGFVNQKHEPVYIVDDPEVFQNFPTIASDVRCLGFVADAFTALRDDYVARINNTDRDYPKYLSGMIPVVGYESFERSFSGYTTYVSTKFSSLLKDDLTINDFSCYLDALKKLMMEQLQDFPVTRSGFVLSRHNSPRNSGLVIELADLDYNSDFEKGEILQSTDFDCFLDYTKSHGFLVDKYAPWRLYADLKHPTIKAFLRRSSQNFQNIVLTEGQVHDIMDSIYRIRSHMDDVFDLQDFVLKVYNDIKNEVGYYIIREYSPTTSEIRQENVFRQEVEFLNAEQWLDLLLFVRMLELGIYDEQEHQRKLNEVLQNYRIYGLNQALEKIGSIMSSYIKENYEKNKQDNTNTRYRKELPRYL